MDLWFHATQDVFDVGTDLIERFVAGEEKGTVEKVRDCQVLEIEFGKRKRSRAAQSFVFENPRVEEGFLAISLFDGKKVLRLGIL